MKTVLIVEPSNTFRQALETLLQDHYRMYACSRCEEAARLLWTYQPEGLLIDLQGTDGMYLLENLQGLLPPVTLTLAPKYPPALAQKLLGFGVRYCMRCDCGAEVAACHVRYFLEHGAAPEVTDKQEIVAMHLQTLGIPYGGGFEDLRVGTPLFAQSPQIRMGKEFYPAVAALRGRENWQQVEKAIRDAKAHAYQNRSDTVWQVYFPDTTRCPRNREFIARLAEFL